MSILSVSGLESGGVLGVEVPDLLSIIDFFWGSLPLIYPLRYTPIHVRMYIAPFTNFYINLLI